MEKVYTSSDPWKSECACWSRDFIVYSWEFQKGALSRGTILPALHFLEGNFSDLQ